MVRYLFFVSRDCKYRCCLVRRIMQSIFVFPLYRLYIFYTDCISSLRSTTPPLPQITQMGKVDHFRNRLEPFADLGSRHCTFCQHRSLVSLHCRTQCMPLYGHSWFHSQRRRDGPAFPIQVYYFSMTSPRYSIVVSSLTLHLQYTVDNAHSSIKFRFMCNVKTFRFCIIY